MYAWAVPFRQSTALVSYPDPTVRNDDQMTSRDVILYTSNSLQYGNNIDKPINLYQARCEYCIMMIALTTLYQDRSKKLLPDVINQYLACYLVVCLLITACTSIDTMVPYINKCYIAQKK